MFRIDGLQQVQVPTKNAINSDSPNNSAFCPFSARFRRADADARFLAFAISRRDSLPAGFAVLILSGIMPFYKRVANTWLCNLPLLV